MLRWVIAAPAGSSTWRKLRRPLELVFRRRQQTGRCAPNRTETRETSVSLSAVEFRNPVDLQSNVPSGPINWATDAPNSEVDPPVWLWLPSAVLGLFQLETSRETREDKDQMLMIRGDGIAEMSHPCKRSSALPSWPWRLTKVRFITGCRQLLGFFFFFREREREPEPDHEQATEPRKNSQEKAWSGPGSPDAGHQMSFSAHQKMQKKPSFIYSFCLIRRNQNWCMNQLEVLFLRHCWNDSRLMLLFCVVLVPLPVLLLYLLVFQINWCTPEPNLLTDGVLGWRPRQFLRFQRRTCGSVVRPRCVVGNSCCITAYMCRSPNFPCNV